jgi:hypothetical protein
MKYQLNHFTVLPNQIFVKWKEKGESYLRFYKFSGNKVLEAKIQPGITTLNIQSLAAGIYAAQISQKGRVTYQ